ncbi:hypothetical protein CWI42_020040 [Ordospora colligata]|uniref:Uncharacterized protein n=1 Tax=Ordospora colligata OC4 TaxID=1354746 RepID=A0A0B2UMH8_9MICR|nr:uncharacterized protein M896_020040 [Ordospora colligata OC4]KHN70170.1 hypothetical protein M896_020040 [Ordospora colligata OC4]TBU19494.1 hypothetical protein CWI42_020040 [Ordospora colligata]
MPINMELIDKLKTQIFSNDYTGINDTMYECLDNILCNYNHSHMVIFARLVEMLVEACPSKKTQRILRIIDLIRFPVKK